MVEKYLWMPAVSDFLQFLLCATPGGGHSTFFQVGVCGPDFQSVGLVNWHLPLKRGACELKISKFRGLWAKIWVKIEAVEAKISKFSQKGVLWNVNWLFCLKWDPCERQERREKGVFRAAHPHTPFLGQCPPGVQPCDTKYISSNYMHYYHNIIYTRVVLTTFWHLLQPSLSLRISSSFVRASSAIFT